MSRNIRFKNLTNQKFGYLTALYVNTERSTTHHTYWVCQCDCGKFRSLQTYQLTSKRVTSCGCMNKRAIKANYYNDCDKRLYRIYYSMKQRCLNPNCKTYASYGKKGITVCDEWENDFFSFQKWAFQNGYNDNLSIDRIDNLKGYSPDNCRWVTLKEQGQNKVNNVWLTNNGKTYIMSEWCKILHFPYSLAKSRSKSLRKKGIEPYFEYVFSPPKRQQH